MLSFIFDFIMNHFSIDCVLYSHLSLILNLLYPNPTPDNHSKVEKIGGLIGSENNLKYTRFFLLKKQK